MKQRQIVVRLDDDQYEWLDNQAKTNDRSIAWIVRDMINKYRKEC